MLFKLPQWTIGAVALLTLLGGILIGRAFTDTPIIQETVVDTVAPKQMQHELEALRKKSQMGNSLIGGLTDKIKGLEERQPTRIIRTADTVFVPVPDTVVGSIVVTDDMKLKLSEFISPISDTIEGRRPEIAEFDISKCDDGIGFSGGKLVCNTPKFGHLYISGFITTELPSISLSNPELFGEIGLTWEPHYRSPWNLDVTYGIDAAIRLRLNRRVELF